MSQIVIISGPPGAGKSTVAESLCGRYDRTVHLKTDELYASIRMGYTKPWLPESDRQNRMVTRAAARAAVAFAQELYAVFVDGVISPSLLAIYVEELREAHVPVHLAVLLPSLEETVRRGVSREETLRVPEDKLREAHQRFTAYGASSGGCLIDNSALSADETADRIMDACGRGDCLVYPPAPED